MRFQDLIHPGGEVVKGIMGIEFMWIDQMLDIASVLNYVEGGDTGGGTGPSEPTITYTHIGNAGGTSGIDDTETQYPNETTAVQFSETDGVFGVDSTSLYTDQGADGSLIEMGVYLDLGMGLASTLLPSQNTVTAPKAGEIVNEDGTITTLDGTYTAVNDIAHSGVI